MGVQPPQGDDTDDVGAVEFGIAELDVHVEESDLSFPATAADVRAAVGDEAVSTGPTGGEMTVAEALDRTDQSQFATRTELLDALHPVFEEERRSGSGVVGLVRDLLPFGG